MTEKEMETLLGRFALPEKFQTIFLQRRRTALQVAHRLSSSPLPSRSDIFFLLDPLPADFLLYAMGRTEEEGVKKAISLYFTELKRARVLLAGKDLKKMGFIPGPIYTEILHALLRGRLEGKISSRQEEMGFVLKKYSPKQPAAVGRKKPALAGKKMERGDRASPG
jgi:tRNA nucleotidyltransferase (CCA-adding enzyme)